MKIIYCSIILFFTISSCLSKKQSTSQVVAKGHVQSDNVQSDAIISNVFASDTLKKHGLYSTEWQDELTKALQQDETNAYLWQQKSMPLYKQGKYQLGRPFLDKAAWHDPDEYLEYRAFMICIFEKNYKEAIVEFEKCISRYGDSYVMDHSYSFYIALSKIQLNEFEAAAVLLEQETERQKKVFGENNIHFLDVFYLGIARFELNQFEQANETFDETLKLYSNFADAQLYKAKCLKKLGKIEAAESLLEEAKINGTAGYTINEDNAIYERYPYQVRWANR